MLTMGRFLGTLLLYTCMICNAQTIAFPPPMTPQYQFLLQNTPPAFLQSSLTDFSIPSNTEHAPSLPSIHNFLSYSSNKDAEQVTTIAPTHYADTHNAFFCRLERKINKKFVTNVRIRLEGF